MIKFHPLFPMICHQNKGKKTNNSERRINAAKHYQHMIVLRRGFLQFITLYTILFAFHILTFLAPKYWTTVLLGTTWVLALKDMGCYFFSLNF